LIGDRQNVGELCQILVIPEPINVKATSLPQ